MNDRCPSGHDSQVIGVEICGLYDGVAYWLCPVDGEVWHRFPEGDYRRERVERYWSNEHHSPAALHQS